MEFINEAERIACVRLHELTAGQAGIFFKQFMNSPLSTLTVLYDEKNDILLLNHDNQMYETVRQTVLDYMVLSEDEKEELQSREDIPDMYKEIFAVIDSVIVRRKAKRDIFILRKQRNEHLPVSIRKAIWLWCDCNENLAMHYAYQYGIIQGRREERARRKAVRHNAGILHREN